MRLRIVPFLAASSGIGLGCAALMELGDPPNLHTPGPDGAAMGDEETAPATDARDQRAVDAAGEAELAETSSSALDSADGASDTGNGEVGVDATTERLDSGDETILDAAVDAAEADAPSSQDDAGDAGAPAPDGLAAYVRADSVSTVVYQGNDRHIHELSLVQGSWHLNDLSILAGSEGTGATFAVSAYVGLDNVGAVVFLNAFSEVDEIFSPTGLDGGDAAAWQWANLSATTAGTPFAWHRSDGQDNVVFCNPTTSHINALYAAGGPWRSSDLSDLTQAPASCTGEPFGYVRGDGTNSTVFVGSNGHVYELYLSNGSWAIGDLTNTATAPLPAAAGNRVTAYVRDHAVSSVLFTGQDGHLHDVHFQNSVWQTQDLTQVAGAPPGENARGYLRSDGISSIVYTNGGHVWEIFGQNGVWQADDLTTLSGAPAIPPAGMGPYPYVRSDGLSAVVFAVPSSVVGGYSVYEISLRSGHWVSNSLTALSGH